MAATLQRHKGNRSKAAEELGIYRRLLYAKMREYGIGE
jgi:DNA-binding NtrC family response regulator